VVEQIYPAINGTLIILGNVKQEMDFLIIKQIIGRK